MNKNQSFEVILEDLIQRKEKANTDNICQLAEILDLNLKTDLAGMDLNSRDLSGGDLQGANLRFTNLSSAKLIGTTLRGADLSYADLRGADFTDADLTGTIFHEIKAQNAIFCDNKGMYEGLKLDLLEQGAIFRDTNPNIILP